MSASDDLSLTVISQVEIRHFNRAQFEAINSTIDVPDSVLVLRVCAPIDPRKLSFVLAPYGLLIIYTEQFHGTDTMRASKRVVIEFDHAFKERVELQLPSGQSVAYPLPHIEY